METKVKNGAASFVATGAKELCAHPRPGLHCSADFPYHFVCPNELCKAEFCPKCYKLANMAGAVRCPRCDEIILFASALDVPAGN
jgi:hypothetical protein